MNGSSFMVSWKVVGATFGLLAGGVAMAKTVTTVTELPAKIDAHAVATLHAQDLLLVKQDSLLRTMQDVRDVEQKLLCVKIAELRRIDWARCLVSLPIGAQ